MIACVQVVDEGVPATVAVWETWKALTERGWEVRKFLKWRDDLDPRVEEPVIGGVGTVAGALRRLGIEPPAIDYPDAFWPFLIDPAYEERTLGWVRQNPGRWPVFVKPASGFKEFTGLVVRSTHDLLGLSHVDDHAPVFVCRPERIVGAEWRVFVIEGQVRDVRPYRVTPDTVAPGLVAAQAIADAWPSAPVGYAFDLANIGTVERPFWRVVEVNDGYSLGTYGLSRDVYAELVVKRWGELVGVPDLW